mmetsp:Transcript_14373/g.21546  ORF Transcript_14373/g.21546 Transcript_14373/m.21546 type:complete len:343 (-) Transcript_14373:271-1299(-)|eukprot:CAMPEP_0185031716 /NCGR_PEP_ID=MMETSP1103-20130426/19333_1 /TAXON_ID=36769 /ORGANISM="Paraphysomonas bandaiensis, Strain Caron Lab Isolate" /LENGTH=342 /DNA_ID=CAMNT_0027567335 /DNA_START=139 /DNA_END=1167 /DNA_ORIENTATION=-
MARVWSDAKIIRQMSTDDMDDDYMCVNPSRHVVDSDFDVFPEEDDEEDHIQEKFGIFPFERGESSTDVDEVSERAWSPPGLENIPSRRRYVKKHSFEPIEADVMECLCSEIQSLVAPIPDVLDTSFEVLNVANSMEDTGNLSLSHPTLEDVLTLFQVLYNTCELEYELALIVVVYLRRISGKGGGIPCSGLRFHDLNWRGVLTSSVILTSKVWDDFAVLNSHVAAQLPCTNIQKINDMEILLATSLGFDLHISELELQNCHSTIKSAVQNRRENVGVSPLTSPRIGSTMESTHSCLAPARRFSKSWSWKRSNKVAVDVADGSEKDELLNGESSLKPKPQASK